MPAYLVVRVDITDPDKYREYMRHTPRIIAEHGGRFIARSANPVTLEGPSVAQRVVVIEFPSLQHAKAFYDSPDYRRARNIRAGAGSAHILAVEGYPEAEWQAALAASNDAAW